MQEFITVPEAAKLLGITDDAIRQAIQRDDILGGKVGGRYYVLKASVEAYKPREYPRDAEKQSAGGQEAQ